MTNQPEIRLVKSGTDYFKLLNELILNAKYEIHLQTYIFEPDETGLEVLENLICASKKGIKVYLVLDFFGSLRMYNYLKINLNENFKLKFFGKIHWKYVLFAGRRLHHKILCVDGEKSLIGGINISDKYKGTKSSPPWLDYAVYFEHYQSELIRKICKSIFQKEFNVVYKKNLLNSKKFNSSILSVLQNDWLRNKNEIYKQYVSLISNAKKEIILINAYFLPGRKVFFAIRKAAKKKKVSIKILFGGKSDIPLIRNATFFIYKLLLRYNNIEIYEWHHSVVHAKTMIVDNKYFMIGSFNLNSLSQYGSIEMNVLIKDHPVINEAKNQFIDILSKSERVNQTPKAHFLNKFISYLSFIILRLSMKFLIAFPFYGNKRSRWKIDD